MAPEDVAGASLKVTAPTGQYDPTKLINWGANRGGFKPEFGYSQRLAKRVLDGYMGVWLFTTNNNFWSHNSFYPRHAIAIAKSHWLI
jgi:hypothetical protein